MLRETSTSRLLEQTPRQQQALDSTDRKFDIAQNLSTISPHVRDGSLTVNIPQQVSTKATMADMVRQNMLKRPKVTLYAS